MKNKIVLLLVSIFLFQFSYSQSKYEIELSEGFVYFDYFNNYPRGFEGTFSGYGLQTEFEIWREFYKIQNIDFKMGFGYTNIYYLDYGFYFFHKEVTSSSYLNLKLGVNYKPNWSKISFLINSSNHLLLDKRDQYTFQNKWYSTIDVGVKFKFFKNYFINFSSPITILPIQSGVQGNPIHGTLQLIDVRVETIGLNIGISHRFQ